MNRFDRQVILPDFGKKGQQRLAEAKVLVIGAGGLGCPALLYLASMGIGTIGIADGDNISESNLNRQNLFGNNHIGKPKAETAAKVLTEKYPDICFDVIPSYLTSENALEVIKKYDVVIDGSDNFGTRYMINDACVILKTPLIMGAIYKYEGQLSVFNFGENPINYRDIYPVPPTANEIPNCSETGVLGVLPGIIGTLQAAETVKLIAGLGKVMTNRILFYNLKTCGFYETEVLPKNDSDKSQIDVEAFRNIDYNITCGSSENISWEKAMEWTGNLESCCLVDIRELDEPPELTSGEAERIPMSVLSENHDRLKSIEHVILFCRSGQRSEKLANELKQKFPEKKIFSVEGGIMHPSFPFKTEDP